MHSQHGVSNQEVYVARKDFAAGAMNVTYNSPNHEKQPQHHSADAQPSPSRYDPDCERKEEVMLEPA